MARLSASALASPATRTPKRAVEALAETTTPTLPFIDGRETREWIATVEPTAAAVGSDSPHEQRTRARSRADGSPAEEFAPPRSSARARSTVSACGRGTVSVRIMRSRFFSR